MPDRTAPAASSTAPPSTAAPSSAAPSPVPLDPDLVALAAEYGVDTHYATDRGARVEVSAETVRRVLGVLGVDTATADAVRSALAARRARERDRLLPPYLVVRSGTPLRRPWPQATYTVETGDGHRYPTVDPGTDVGALPPGYHTLHAATPERTGAARLIVTPPTLPGPRRRSWGLLAQLYSVLPREGWGMGDLGALAGLATWAGHLGASFILVNPLHAYVPGPLPDPSPYRPSTRRFPDPRYLRIESIPEYRDLTGADRRQVDELAARGHALTGDVLDRGALIDREAVWDLKEQALRLLHRVPRGARRQAALAAYIEREGEGLTDYATWCALARVHGTAWRSWPPHLRAPDASGVAAARERFADEIAFQQWLNWIVDEQLAKAQQTAVAAGMEIGLVHDLAVGVDPEGADAWALQRYLAPGTTVGCPADDFNPRGQDWGLPPWRPDTLAEAGYAPFADVVRGILRRSGALRLDHIMGLFRLWWVPRGAPASEGAYVRYDHEAMLGVLTLEAHLAGSMIIGEDLGTVEPSVPAELAGRGILGTSVLRFEYLGGAHGRSGPLPAHLWRADCLATLTTHDLPSTAAWLSGEHVDLQDRLGLLTAPRQTVADAAAAERDGWLAELDRAGVTGPDQPQAPGMSPAAVSLHRFLAMTPARMIGVWLPDLVGDRRPQNLPGTVHQFPNWRLPVADGEDRPLSLEQVTAAPAARVVAALYRDLPDPPDAGGCVP